MLLVWPADSACEVKCAADVEQPEGDRGALNTNGMSEVVPGEQREVEASCTSLLFMSSEELDFVPPVGHDTGVLISMAAVLGFCRRVSSIKVARLGVWLRFASELPARH